jgi:long-chain acyl-CoA synthetase
LQFDSLSRIDLIVALEQGLGVRLTAKEAADCYTVRDLAQRLLQAVPVGAARDRQVGTSFGWQKVLGEALAADGSDTGCVSDRPAGPLFEILRYCVLSAVWFSARFLVRLDVHGLENLPDQGGFVLCANHQSYLDAALLFSSLPHRLVRRTVSLGKTRVFARPTGRWLADRCNIAVVDPDANLVEAMQISARALHRQKVLILFPEGERTIDGEILPLRRGAAVLSCHLQVPIIPVVLDGTHKIWPRGRRFQRLAPVTIRCLPPMFPPSPRPRGNGAGFDADTAHLTADLQGRMEAALAAIRSRAGRR